MTTLGEIAAAGDLPRRFFNPPPTEIERGVGGAVPMITMA
jgi:hypothetical protein